MDPIGIVRLACLVPRSAALYSGLSLGRGADASRFLPRSRVSCRVRNGRHRTVHSKTRKSLSGTPAPLLALLFLSSFSFAQTRQVSATIDASKTGAPISPYLYGQFLEHIGGIVNNGIWAEMLDDRKFYHPISSQAPAAPAGPAWMRRNPPRRWTPVGADELVTMDASRAYSGDHSPRIALSRTEAHGILQAGLAVRTGK